MPTATTLTRQVQGIFGSAVRTVPIAALQTMLAAALGVVKRNHPGVFDRLEGFYDARYVIDPSDLPFVFQLRPDPERPSLTAHWRDEPIEATARISGRMLSLVDLLEGQLDGDALFFSRDISIEGDTSAVLALRNAIEAEEIVLFSEIADALGPLGWPVRAVGEKGPDAIAAVRGQINRIGGLAMMTLATLAPSPRRKNRSGTLAEE